MLMEYDDKTIPYTIEYAKENKYKVWLNSQMYLIYKFYETAQPNILLVKVEAYALKYECFSFHYFYFKKDLKYKHFNLREFRCKNRKYKAERYLNSKKDVITPVATIFKDIYEDILLF